MQIVVNGEPMQLDAAFTLTQLLEHMGLAGRRVAVEVNRAIVPRSQHATHQIHEGDQIELVHAMGGG